MSYDLMISTSNELMDCFHKPEPWKVDFLGHSEYQFRHFVIKSGNPSADTQYKQACREAWSRMGALRQARYVGQQNQGKLAIAEAELQRLKETRAWWGWRKKKREGEIMLQQAEIENLDGAMRELKLDIEHRILREAKLSLKVLQELRPAEGTRMNVEKDNWELRANLTQDSKLKELIREDK